MNTEIEREKVLKEKGNLEKILDANEDMVIIQDKKKRIVWANKAAEKNLETTEETLIGQQCHTIFQDSEDVCRDCPLSDEQSSDFNKPLEVYSNRLKTNVLHSHIPLLSGDGELTGVAHLIREKTTAVSKDNEEVSLASSTAHDQYISDHYTELNDIISAILIGTDNLCNMHKEDSSFTEKKGFIGEATERLRDIVDELKELQANKSL